MIAAELADRLGHEDLAAQLGDADAITDAIASTVAAYRGATRAALAGNIEGVLAVGEPDPAAVDAPGVSPSPTATATTTGSW